MFDFAWSEIALIGAVALIAIGPKDMPAAIRTVSGMIKKARRMAAEFQTHVDEMVREADLGDVKKAFSDIRNLDIPSLLEKHVDPDHSIRNTFAENPLEPTYPTASQSPVQYEDADQHEDGRQPGDEGGDQWVAERSTEAPAVPVTAAEPEEPEAPAFVPPGMVPPPATNATTGAAKAPAFIPPQAALQRHSQA